MLEQLVSNHQNRVSHSHRRFATASSPGYSTVLSRQVALFAPFAPPSRLSGLHQRRSQPHVTFTGSAAFTFTCTFMIARAHCSPRCQVAGSRKTLHVNPNLGDDHFSC